MKKLVQVVVALLLLWAFAAGCGPKAQPAQTQPATATPPATSAPQPSAVPGAPPA